MLRALGQPLDGVQTQGRACGSSIAQDTAAQLRICLRRSPASTLGVRPAHAPQRHVVLPPVATVQPRQRLPARQRHRAAAPAVSLKDGLAAAPAVEARDADNAPDPDLIPAFGFVALLLALFGYIQVDFPHLLKGFAAIGALQGLTLLTCQQTDFDKVRSVVAPAVLAVHALSLCDPGKVALGIFGIYLSMDLKLPTLLGWSTLAFALYINQGPVWMASGVALNNGFRMLDGLRDKDAKVPLVGIFVLSITAWGFITGRYELWVVSLGFGEVAKSFLGLVMYQSQRGTLQRKAAELKELTE